MVNFPPAERGPVQGYMRQAYQRPPLTSLARRIGISEVEEGYDEATARAQGARCLKCSLNTIFDGTRCILCNGCVDVCPYDCLKIVSVSQLSGDEAPALLARWGQAGAAARGSAMLFDPDHCIRCALCAKRCPTGAITMEDFRFQDNL